MTYSTGKLPSTAALARAFVLENQDTWAADYKQWALSPNANNSRACESIRALFKEASKNKDQPILDLLSKGFLQVAFKGELKTDLLHEVFLRNSNQKPWSSFYAIVDSTNYKLVLSEDRKNGMSLSELIKNGRAIINDKKTYPNIAQTLKNSPLNRLAFIAAIADAQYNKDTSLLQSALTTKLDINDVFGANTGEAQFLMTAQIGINAVMSIFPEKVLPNRSQQPEAVNLEIIETPQAPGINVVPMLEAMEIHPDSTEALLENISEALKKPEIDETVVLNEKAKSYNIGLTVGRGTRKKEDRTLGRVEGFVAATVLAAAGFAGFLGLNNTRVANNPAQPSAPVAANIQKIAPSVAQPPIAHTTKTQTQSVLASSFIEPEGLDKTVQGLFKKAFRIALPDTQAAQITQQFRDQGINIDDLLSTDRAVIESKNGEYFIKFSQRGQVITGSIPDKLIVKSANKNTENSKASSTSDSSTSPVFSIAQIFAKNSAQNS